MSTRLTQSADVVESPNVGVLRLEGAGEALIEVPDEVAGGAVGGSYGGCGEEGVRCEEESVSGWICIREQGRREVPQFVLQESSPGISELRCRRMVGFDSSWAWSIG